MKHIDYKNGDHYEGDVVDGKRHGHGYMSYALNGYTAEYEGEWRDDMRCGHGVYQKWSMGGGASHNYQYDGEWLDDKEHGIGVSVNSDEKGPHLSTICEEYRGEFKNGKRDGHGVIVCDGYDGEFANGKEYFEGEFKEGQADGHGVFTAVNGDKLECEYSHGNKHGHGIITLADGRKFEADWNNGSFVFDSLKNNSSQKEPMLLVSENHHGFGYYESMTCIFTAKKGKCRYDKAFVIYNNNFKVENNFLNIVELTDDSVTFEVTKQFDQKGDGFIDTIRRGETKKYKTEYTHTGRMYDDDFSYSSGSELMIVCK